MSNNLTTFLVDLAGDPELQAAYEADADAVMKRADLSEAEQAALRSGEPKAIAALLDFEGHSGFVPICFCRMF